MAIKFSQFVLKTLPSELDYIVGYTGTENLQITPDNFLAPYLGAYLPLAGGTMTGSTNHGDNIKSIYGTGGDFEIYHSGSTSYIADVGSGDLKVLFSNDFIIEAINGETCATFTENGAVDLYYDNTLMVSTVSEGVNLPDNKALFLDNTNNNNPVYFRNAGTNAATLQIGRGTTPGSNVSMEISTGGDVGIGVVPATKLDIGGMADPVVRIISDAGGDPQLRFDGSAANRAGLIKFYDNGAAAGGFIDYHHLGDKMNFGAGSVSTVTMTVSDGDVGIGTDTPDERLHIKNSSGANIILCSDANAQNSGVYMTEGASAVNPKEYGAYTYYDGTNNAFKIATGTTTLTDKLTIDRDTGDATFARHIILGDGGQLQCGPLSGGDLKFYWDTSDGNIINKTGHLYIKNQANDKNIYFETDDGVGGTAPYLTLDGLDGICRFSKEVFVDDNVKMRFGNGGDLNIYHDTTNSIIRNVTGNLYLENQTDDGDIIFKSDNGSGGNTEYFRLDGGDVEIIFSKNTVHLDNVKAKFGGGNDLQIYHDGVNSYIEDLGTGNMYIQFYERLRFQDNTGGGGTIAAFNVDSSGCQLYHIGALKIQTTATGTVTTGQMDITALNTAPASAGAAGTLGEIRYTADYIYVCTATNTWKRTALTTW